MYMLVLPPDLVQWFKENSDYHRTTDGRTKLVCPESSSGRYLFTEIVGKWDPARVHQCKHCGFIAMNPIPIVDGERKLPTFERTNGKRMRRNNGKWEPEADQ